MMVLEPPTIRSLPIFAAISAMGRQKKRTGRENDADVRISDIGTDMNLAMAGNYRGWNLSRCSLLMSIERRSLVDSAQMRFDRRDH